MTFMNMPGCCALYGRGTLLQFKLEYFLQILAEHCHILCMQHRLYLQGLFITGCVCVCVYVYMYRHVEISTFIYLQSFYCVGFIA